jgi:hypothetical protein
MAFTPDPLEGPVKKHLNLTLPMSPAPVAVEMGEAAATAKGPAELAQPPTSALFSDGSTDPTRRTTDELFG